MIKFLWVIKMNHKLIKKLFDCDGIEALVLGGSRATGVYDEKSDYDYYVYTNRILPEIERRNLLDEFVIYMEYSNSFWELEDDGTLKNGVDIEFIYREIEDMELSMDNLLVKGNISMGYTTCFVDNLLKSQIIFDKQNRLKNMREKYSGMLTNDFYDKIINKNFLLIMDKMPSMYYQVEKAIARKDELSINHRSSAYFEIYFDIVFALNRKTHPGEKRMLEMASKLDFTPEEMEKDITSYFENLFVDNEKSLRILNSITIKLYTLLTEKGYRLTLDSYKEKR